MIRSILAVGGGAVVAYLIIAVIEFADTKIYPPPPGLDFSDREALRAAMANMPPGAFVGVLVAHAVGTFSGAWLAATIARRAQVVHALIIGVLLMIAGIGNMVMLPHPAWFCVLDLLLYLPAASIGERLARRRTSSGDLRII